MPFDTTDPQFLRSLAWVARSCLAVLFAAGLWHKARAFRDFITAVGQYRLLPVALVPAAATGLLLAECVVLAGLLSPPLPPAPFAWGAAALLTLYALAMAINLGRGREAIDCGCHGFSGRQRIAGWMVARNLLLATVAALLARLTHLPEPLPPPVADHGWPIGGAVLLSCLLYSAAHHLAARAARSAAR
jgi:hypothetical protein